MSPILSRPDLFDQPIWLSDKDPKSLYHILNLFFIDYRMSEVRDFLWRMTETCLTSDSPHFAHPEQRADLLLFRENLEKLIEADLLINQNQGPAPDNE